MQEVHENSGEVKFKKDYGRKHGEEPMNALELLKKSLKRIEKEKEWTLQESRYLQKLKYAAKVRDFRGGWRFGKKAARSERRIHQQEEHLLELLDHLIPVFPEYSSFLSESKNKTQLFERNILKKVSYIEGTIPKIIKERGLDYGLINAEIEAAMNEGVRPLVALLEEVREKLNLLLAEGEALRKKQIVQAEKSLQSYPFILMFHSANDLTYVNNILKYQNALPDSFMGRKLEYAFEIDYFWLEHDGKLFGFIGHAPHGLTPKDIYAVLQMKGSTSGENLLKRKGLMLPEWILSRIGKMRLMIEIKSGRGLDTKALDLLVSLIKSYHLENSIIFYGFSQWALSYLKQKLPRATTIIIGFYPFAGGPFVHLPLNRPWKIFSQFWKIPFLPRKMSGIDGLSTFVGFSEDAVRRKVLKVSSTGKFHYGRMIKRKKKFVWLLKHGSRGGLVWVEAPKLIEWVTQKGMCIVPSKSSS